MDAVENLSMLENAKVCTLLYISSRRFAPKPTDARAAMRAASTPVASWNAASSSKNAPNFQTAAMLPPSMPKSMRLDMNSGITISNTTSSAESDTVTSAGPLFSRRLRDNV